ncbi:MAG: thermonuclease family protein [Alphaproteobacteria bacterium]
MIKHSVIILTFLASVLFPLYASAEGFPSSGFAEMRSERQAEVIEVVDANTLLLGDGRIARLSGIDVPANEDFSVSEWQVAARNILRDMLLAQRVQLYQTPKKDWGRTNRMGHHLMHVERMGDKAWVQGTLLKLGLARVKTEQRTPEMAAEMLALEAAARAEKLGLWAEERFKILTPEEAGGAIGRFAIVEGDVQSVTLNKNRIFINFGANWRDDFTVTLDSAARRAFNKAGIDPMNWGNKRIRARGYLKAINGASMGVDHIAAIEVLDAP